MKPTIYKYSLCVAVGLSLLMAACSDDDFVRNANDPGLLSFEISTADKIANASPETRSGESGLQNLHARQFNNSSIWLLSYTEDGIDGEAFVSERTLRTRALPEPITIGNFKEKYNAFTLYASQTDPGNNVTFSIKNENISLIEHIENEQTTLTANLGYPWPGENYKMRFFAFAPSNAIKNVAPAIEGGNGVLAITDTIPEEVNKQYDLIGTYRDAVTRPANNKIALTFNHLLAAVKVKFKDGISVNSVERIEIKGIRNSGSYRFGENNWNIWQSSNDKKTYWTHEMSAISESDNEITFMLMPQSLGNDATIEVKLVGEDLLTGSLANERWEMGKTRTYVVSKSDAIFRISPDTVYYTYKGASEWESFNIESTKGNRNIGWSIDALSLDEGKTWNQNPDWLKLNSRNGSGGSNDILYYQVEAVKGIKVSAEKHVEILKKNPSVGTQDAPYDLSTDGGKSPMNTANCYLINAAGYYSLPLVYGNSIKNGKENANAYSAKVSGKNMLATFVNHLNESITSPYIYNNKGCTPKDASLVWQDEKDLVTNIGLSNDGKNLLFKVEEANIKQGNAIIAVRDDSGKIMWSWHIWVTDFELGSGDIEVRNNAGKTFMFMSQNIGCCSPQTTLYEGRKVQIRFKQDETGITKVATIIQRPDETFDDPGNQPYFQYGRKDPMLPYVQGRDKECHVTDDKYKFAKNMQQQSIGQVIQNPHVYYANTDDNKGWCTNYYTNLWSADNNMDGTGDNTKFLSEISVKTIYDPSPVGYCIPPSGACSGFTIDGKQQNEIVKINTPYLSFNDSDIYKGWKFYCTPMTGGIKDENAKTILFANTGYRFCSTGDVSYYGQLTWCWSSTPCNQKQAYVLYAAYTTQDRRVNPTFASNNTYGCIVRPIREK